MALDDKLLTLEDFNTWILKYRYSSFPYNNYKIPNIQISPLYVEKNNKMSDIIGLPNGIEYRVYYHNKPIEEFYIPTDHYDNYSFRVVTKSNYPYVDSDVDITVPVQFKEVETVDDFNNYNYIILNQDIENTDFTIDNDVTIFSNKTFNTCNITINGNVTIEGNINLIDTIITVNGSLTLKNGRVYVENNNNDYSIVNNNNLIMNYVNIHLLSGLCINNESLTFINNTINPIGIDIPIIYDRGNYEMKNNFFGFIGDFDEFGLCILRTDNIDVFNIFTNNTFHYTDVVLNLSGVDYNISGNGFAYTMVHKDDIKLYELNRPELRNELEGD